MEKIIQNKINNFNRSITSMETETVAKTLPTKEVQAQVSPLANFLRSSQKNEH